ncbi:unnamed protein product [Darwinula stevensoni]|uniref:Tetraspanin n=1 Tax=Darwinula stevensoni TaxID=69355 RepID=A0A7R8X4V7_9CRUS|nr:unnamed protein product [Darwinula stevensoni]CAG0884107.1 unnamed protein product [Darwinula stevensoni]
MGSVASHHKYPMPHRITPQTDTMVNRSVVGDYRPLYWADCYAPLSGEAQTLPRCGRESFKPKEDSTPRSLSLGGCMDGWNSAAAKPALRLPLLVRAFASHTMPFSGPVLRLQLAGLALLIMSLWLYFDTQENVQAVRDMDQYMEGVYIFMVVGSIMVVVGFLGCCGALCVSQVILTAKQEMERKKALKANSFGGQYQSDLNEKFALPF